MHTYSMMCGKNPILINSNSVQLRLKVWSSTYKSVEIPVGNFNTHSQIKLTHTKEACHSTEHKRIIQESKTRGNMVFLKGITQLLAFKVCYVISQNIYISFLWKNKSYHWHTPLGSRTKNMFLFFLTNFTLFNLSGSNTFQTVNTDSNGIATAICHTLIRKQNDLNMEQQ